MTFLSSFTNEPQFAKLEQNLITAFFLANFDYILSDKSGNLVTSTPPVNFNGHSAQKPTQHIYLKFQEKWGSSDIQARRKIWCRGIILGDAAYSSRHTSWYRSD